MPMSACVTIHQPLNGTVSIRFGPHVVGRYAESGRPLEPPKGRGKDGPWKPWKTKPRFPTALRLPFPPLKKTKGKEGSMKQADRSSVNKSGQIQKLPTHLNTSEPA